MRMLQGSDFARSLLGKSIKLRFPQPKNVTKGPSLRHIHKKMRVPTAPSFTKFHSARLTRTAESPRNRGAGRRALPLNEFRTNRRRQWRLRREPGLSEIASKGSGLATGQPGMVIRDAARGRGSPRFDPGSRTGYRCNRTCDGRHSSSPGHDCRNWGTPTPACRYPRQS